ncbi:MAG: trigger factor [Clostridia bacterium]|nr:trigger factor [Clostridia bacterium]
MINMEKLEGSQVKLTFDIAEDELERAMAAAYRRTASRYNVHGFRKGKAPRTVIENAYGKLVFFEDAFEQLWPPMVDAAIAEQELNVLDDPKIDVDAIRAYDDAAAELPEGIAVRFSATVSVMPEVKLGEYKGIEAHRREYTVTDEMVDAELDRMRSERASIVSVERPVENGDTVDIDYSGSVDGVKFEGGTAEHQELEIGSNRFIPGFEEQLIGMSAGEDRDIVVTFPEEYHAEELAGKEAVFAIHLHDVSAKVLDELDDAFAQEASEFETLDELRADIRANYEKNAAQREKNDFEDEVLGKVVENAEFEVPEVMIRREVENMLGDMDRNLQQQGLNLDIYLRYSGTSIEQLAAQMAPDAEKRVRTRLVLEQIVKDEAIEVTEEEVSAAIDTFCASFGDEERAKFLEGVNEGVKGYFEDREKIEKAIRLVVESANVIE